VALLKKYAHCYQIYSLKRCKRTGLSSNPPNTDVIRLRAVNPFASKKPTKYQEIENDVMLHKIKRAKHSKILLG
jgi:hypothetical protein